MEFLSEIIHRSQFLIENGYHEKNALIIVLEGKFECTMDGKTLTVSKGNICAFEAGHFFQRKVLDPIRCVYMQFTIFPELIKSGLISTADTARTESTIRYLEKAVLQNDQNTIEHLLQDLLMLHRFRKQRRSRTDETVARCIEYYHEHLTERITLDLLATEFSISKQGLIRKFRTQTDKTPMEYLSDLRLDHSKILLKDSPLSIGEIALQCGYDNVYYFSNHFKHASGISPSGYRKLMTL